MINSKLKISVRFNVCNIYKNTFNLKRLFLIKLELKYKKELCITVYYQHWLPSQICKKLN